MSQQVIIFDTTLREAGQQECLDRSGISYVVFCLKKKKN